MTDAADDFDAEYYVRDCITKWVWSGFYDAAEVRDMMEDVLEPDCDVRRLEAFIESEFQRKLVAEASWPVETDCDRLDRVFDRLHAEGICALANAGYTMSDGCTEVAEAVGDAPKGCYHGYCFYHGQDVERALNWPGIMLAFGDLEGDKERSAAVGRQIVEALTRAGFGVVWEGAIATRIEIPAFDWKRRYGE